MDWISSLFLTGYGQGSRTSFNTCIKKFWILTNKCGNNLKHEIEAGEPWPFSLVFVFKIIFPFIGQNPKFFYACVEEGCSASLTIAHEKQT